MGRITVLTFRRPQCATHLEAGQGQQQPESITMPRRLMSATAASLLTAGCIWFCATAPPPGAAQQASKAGGEKARQPGVPAEIKMTPYRRKGALDFFDNAKQERPKPRLQDLYDLLIVRGTDLPTSYLVLNVEFDNAQSCADLRLPGAHLIARFDRFADLFIDSKEALLALEALPSVRWIDLETRVQAPPPGVAERAREATRDLPEPIVRGGQDGVEQTGKGVIIAIVDSGVDFRHPDFIAPGADGKPTSRILYFWDTLADSLSKLAPPVRFPNGKHIGALYDQKELTAAIRGEAYVPVWDNNSHGTCCASVAAGNGRAAAGDLKAAKAGMGVAPEADLIAVRVGGAARSIENGFLLGAICDWVDQVAKAARKPYVISCSWGNAVGYGHDGSSVQERQLDARFPLDGPAARGRAACFAAGNSGLSKGHAEVECAPGQKGQLSWYTKEAAILSIYTDAKDPKDVRVEGVDPQRVTTYVHKPSRTVVTDLIVPPSGQGGFSLLPEYSKLELSSASGKALKADAFLRSDDDEKAYFADSCLKYTKQLDSPGSAANVITVGSYDWNSRFHRRGEFLDYLGITQRPIRVGALSDYSSRGPSRAGVVKPDIVAPGQWFIAAAPSNVDLYRDTSGMYRMFNGTSAATPYTAGVVALMLQKNPNLTTGQIKKLLHEKAAASQDEKTGAVPNPQWGHGKLDRKAVLAVLAAIAPPQGE